MSAQGPHKVTEMFEAELCRYTGAPYAVAVDSATNAIGLCLMHDLRPEQEVWIPERTYPSVPCEIILAGGRVKFWTVVGESLTGAYQLSGTRIWDSALRFTADMYDNNWMKGQLVCISFTGAYKHLKLGKGGAVLLDDAEMYRWLKKARNSGRDECSYHEDNFTMLGRNYYMMPQIAAQGLLLMNQFYNLDGTKKHMPDLCLPYPDLSKFPIYTK